MLHQRQPSFTGWSSQLASLALLQHSTSWEGCIRYRLPRRISGSSSERLCPEATPKNSSCRVVDSCIALHRGAIPT